MAPINRTANSHQTSFLVSQHVPAFVRDDHPQFVTFLEKYYEFASNNSILETSEGSGAYYYGFDSASKLLQDIHDVDQTDFNEFVESFKKQYAYSFPQELYNGVNKSTFYKNLIQFYQAVGTEDSFRALFRLLYNEEIEIYYLDTLLLSRKIFNSRTYYNQGSLCKTFNIEIIDAHRALGDVLCLEMLYLRLCQKGNLNNIDEVYKYLNFI